MPSLTASALSLYKSREHRQTIALIRVWGDFNQWGKTVPLGREDLLKQDIERQGEQLREGLHVIVEEPGIEAEGVLEMGKDGRWLARILPGTLKHLGPS